MSHAHAEQMFFTIEFLLMHSLTYKIWLKMGLISIPNINNSDTMCGNRRIIP